MLVEFASPDDEEKTPLATAEWRDGAIAVSSQDEQLRTKLAHAFRRIPVVSDDPSYRRLGTSGPVVLQPGDLAWFRTVAQGRAETETGLDVRFVPGAPVGGYDPAAGYLPFEEQVERLDARAS